jgi:hypothetical protein
MRAAVRGGRARAGAARGAGRRCAHHGGVLLGRGAVDGHLVAVEPAGWRRGAGGRSVREGGRGGGAGDASQAAQQRRGARSVTLQHARQGRARAPARLAAATPAAGAGHPRVLGGHDLLHAVCRGEGHKADAAVALLGIVLGHVRVLHLAKALKVGAELLLCHAGGDAGDEDARGARGGGVALGQRHLGLALPAVDGVLGAQGALRRLGVHERDEAEAAALARVAVLHDLCALEHAELGEVEAERVLAAGMAASAGGGVGGGAEVPERGTPALQGRCAACARDAAGAAPRAAADGFREARRPPSRTGGGRAARSAAQRRRGAAAPGAIGKKARWPGRSRERGRAGAAATDLVSQGRPSTASLRGCSS